MAANLHEQVPMKSLHDSHCWCAGAVTTTFGEAHAMKNLEAS